MKRNCAVKFLLPSIVFAPALLMANGLRLLSQDGFATARGEAFAATADNPSAIYYNPAGITQIEGTQTRSGVYGLDYDSSFTPPAAAPNAGRTYHINHNLAAAPSFFGTLALKDTPVTLGLGAYAPYGGALAWPENTGFRSVAIESRLFYVRLNPVIAVKLPWHLSLAAGANVDFAKLKLKQGLRASLSGNSFRFVGDGWSAGYNAGVLWQPHKTISLGATFRSESPFSLEGRSEFERQPILQPSSRHARADFTFPLTAVAGISFRPTPKWNIEFDADYTDWSSISSTSIRLDNPPFPIRAVIPLTLDWKPSWVFELGATRRFDNGWHASAGYVFNQNSVPNDYYTPLLADLDRHFVTAGVGHAGKRINWDVAYQFGYGPPHTVTGSAPSSDPALSSAQTADGTYKFMSHAVFVSVGMKF